MTPYTLDCSISFLAPQQTFFYANSYRTCRSTGSLLLCKKDLSPFTCSCILCEIRCTCSLSTKWADPLLKTRLFKNKTTIANPCVCVCLCVYIYAERVRALCHDLGWLSGICNQYDFSQCCWDRDFNIWINNQHDLLHKDLLNPIPWIYKWYR